MATERVGRAVLEFSTDSRQFNADVDKAGQKIVDLKKKAGETGAAFTSLSGDLGKVGLSIKALTVGLGGAVLGLGATAVKFSNDFNGAMANVASLIPGNTKRVLELKASVQSLAVEVGKSTDDMAAGLYQTISAFGDTADTVKILEINAKAAAAGLSTTQEAIGLTSAVTKGYGEVTAETVQHASDLAQLTVRLGQTTFPELAGSIGRVVPLAANLKVSQEELFAVMATGTGVTGNAAEVSTQLRGVLQSLMAPTDTLQGLFTKLGVSSGEALIKQRGLQGAIALIVKAAADANVPLQKYLGSIEGQTLALALAGPQATAYTGKLAEMQKAAGATDAAFREQTEGINKSGFALEQWKVRASVAAQKVGDLITGMGPLGLAIGGIAAGARPAISALGQLATGIGTTVARLAGWTTASTVNAAAQAAQTAATVAQTAATEASVVSEGRAAVAAAALTAAEARLTAATAATDAATLAHGAASVEATAAMAKQAQAALALTTLQARQAAAAAASTAATVAATAATGAQDAAYVALVARLRDTSTFTDRLSLGYGGAITVTLAAVAATWKLETATAGAVGRLREGTATLGDYPAVAANAVARGLNPVSAAWRDISKAIEDASTAWDHFRGNKPTMPDLPDPADRPKNVFFDASVPGVPKAADLKAINDALIAGLNKSQQATKDFRAELAAARAEIAGLSKNDLADLTAAIQSNAFSTEALQAKYKLSDVALKLFTDSVKAGAKEHKAAETAVSRHRAELEKLEDWLANKGVLTTTGYSNALGEMVEKLNLAAREGTPTLRAALSVLAPEFDRVAAAAKASGQDVEVVNGIYHDFLDLAGTQDIADSMAAWEAANVETAASLDAIVSTLPSVSVAADGTALSATMMTDAFHEFGLKTPQELQKAADAAVFAYQQIVATVGAHAPAAIAAHAKMVEAINAQTGKVPSYWETTVFPRVSTVVQQMQTAISGSFAQMMLHAKSFRDGFLDVWQSIKAGVLNILASIADAFLNSFLKGILGALAGQKGAFSQAFAGLFGGGGGLLQKGGLLAGLLGGGGGIGAAGGIGGGVTMVGTGAGGVLAPIGMGGTAAGGGTAGAGGGAAGGGLSAGVLTPIAAAGAGIAIGMLGKQLFGGAGWKAGALGAAGGAATGAAIGAAFAPATLGLSVVIGGLAGAISGLFGKTQSQKVNDARDQLMTQAASQFGGTGKSGTGAGTDFAIIGESLNKATGSNALFDKFLKASTMKDFEAATKEVAAALEDYKKKTDDASASQAKLAEQMQAVRGVMKPDEVEALSKAFQQARLDGFAGTEDDFLKQQLDFYQTLQEGDARLKTFFYGETILEFNRVAAAGGDAAAKIRVQFLEQFKIINDQIKGLDDELAKIDASEKPEAHMGTEEKRARERIAKQRAFLEEQLKQTREASEAAAKAAADAQAAAAKDAEIKVGGSLDNISGKYVGLGDTAEAQAERARLALLSIGKSIPAIELRYRYKQEGPGLPEGADVHGLSTGGLVTRYLASGGPAKAAGALAASAVLAAGLLSAPVYAAEGAWIPPRGTDTVRAMLTPREFVHQVSAVDRYKEVGMAAVNAGEATIVLGAPTLPKATIQASQLAVSLAGPAKAAAVAYKAVGGPVSVSVEPTPLRLLAGGPVPSAPAYHTHVAGSQYRADAGPVYRMTGGPVSTAAYHSTQGSVAVQHFALGGPVSHSEFSEFSSQVSNHRVQGGTAGAVTGDVSYRTIGGPIYRSIGGSVIASRAFGGPVHTSSYTHVAGDTLAADWPVYRATGGPVQAGAPATAAGLSTLRTEVARLDTIRVTPEVQFVTDTTAIRAAVSEIHQLPPEHDVNVRVDSAGLDVVALDVEALPSTHPVTVPVSSTGLETVLNGFSAIPASKPVTVPVSSAGLAQVLGGLSTIPASKPVAVPVSSAGLAPVLAGLATIPPSKPVAVPVSSVGLEPVLAGLATIPPEKPVAVPVSSTGIPQVIAGITTIPQDWPVGVPVTSTGVATVLAAIQTIPVQRDVLVDVREQGIAAIVKALAEIPRAITVTVTTVNTGTTPTPAPQPPSPGGVVPRWPDVHGSPGMSTDPTPYPDPGMGRSPTPYVPGPTTGTGSGGSFTVMVGHDRGGVFSRPHLAAIAEGGHAEIVGSVPFMTNALTGALTSLDRYVVPKLTVDRLGGEFLRSLSSERPAVSGLTPRADSAPTISDGKLLEALLRVERAVLAGRHTSVQIDGKEIARAESFNREHAQVIRSNNPPDVRSDYRKALGMP